MKKNNKKLKVMTKERFVEEYLRLQAENKLKREEELKLQKQKEIKDNIVSLKTKKKKSVTKEKEEAISIDKGKELDKVSKRKTTKSKETKAIDNLQNYCEKSFSLEEPKKEISTSKRKYEKKKSSINDSSTSMVQLSFF